jgi:hypothetical protein
LPEEVPMSASPFRLVLAAACFAGAFAAPARAQNVDVQANGIQVGFPGTNCSVYYDRRGRFRGARPGCNPGLIDRADRAVAARVRPNYGPGPGGAHGNAPRMFIARNGAGQVTYPRGRCTVSYLPNGRRRSVLPGCTRRQVRDADRLFAAQRRRAR